MHVTIIACILFPFAVALPAVEHPVNETLQISPRIADGIEQPPKTNYYEVAIVSDATSQPVVLCSGVLIKTEWILTSAYCIKKKTIWRVLLGANTIIDVSVSGQSGILVDDVIPHPSFNSNYMIHDIALLHVKSATSVTSITLAELPPLPITATEYNGQYARIIGYGYQGSEGSIMNLYALRYKDVWIEDIAHCVQCGDYMNYYKLCTGGRAICMGDQGGPLMIGNRVIGIASAALKAYNCEVQNSATYTRVNYYRQWIDQTILTHKC